MTSAELQPFATRGVANPSPGGRPRGPDGPLPRGDCGGPAAQDVRPAGGGRTWDFAFATGIECSNPSVVDPNGGRLRRDLLEECGHYRYFREDLALVKDLGTTLEQFIPEAINPDASM